MQAPLYPIRKSLLEAFIQTVHDPASRWSVSDPFGIGTGLRDVSTIVAGYISQLALSFCCWCSGYNRLWYDLRTGRSYTTDVYGGRADAGPVTTRCELDIVEDGDCGYLFTTSVVDEHWDTPLGPASYFFVGAARYLAAKNALEICNYLGNPRNIPDAAVTVRFLSLDTMLWMDSDGVIYEESCAT